MDEKVIVKGAEDKVERVKGKLNRRDNWGRVEREQPFYNGESSDIIEYST
jgi:hypothetical protein